MDESEIKKLNLKLNPNNDIFKEESNIKDDEIIKRYIIHYKLKKYECEVEKCKVKANWNGKRGFLYLKRKNNINNDLRITNLKFICPNCYFQDFGDELFLNVLKKTTKICPNCGKNPIKNKNFKFCYTCNQKIKYGSKDLYKLNLNDKMELSSSIFGTNFENEDNNKYVNLFMKSSLDTNIFGNKYIIGNKINNNYAKKSYNSNNKKTYNLNDEKINESIKKDLIENLPEHLQFVINIDCEINSQESDNSESECESECESDNDESECETECDSNCESDNRESECESNSSSGSEDYDLN